VHEVSAGQWYDDADEAVTRVPSCFGR